MKNYHTLGAVIFSLFSVQAYADTVQKQMNFEDVNQFTLNNFAANVDIKTHDAADGKVTFSFSAKEDLEEFLDNLEVSNSRGILTLTDKRHPKGSSTTNISIGFFGITINGKPLWESKSKDLPSAVIHLPKQTTLNLNIVMGTLKLGDLEAPLTIRTKGAGSADVGKISGNTQVHISGAGDFTAKAITGNTLTGMIAGAGDFRANSINVNNATFEIKGAGDIKLKEGTVSNTLTASVKGAGSCDLNVTTQNARLDVKGVGSIHLKEATGTVDRSVAGIGTIRVGKS